MKLLIDYNIEIVKLLKADIYTRDEILLTLEKALRNINPYGNYKHLTMHHVNQNNLSYFNCVRFFIPEVSKEEYYNILSVCDNEKYSKEEFVENLNIYFNTIKHTPSMESNITIGIITDNN